MSRSYAASAPRRPVNVAHVTLDDARVLANQGVALRLIGPERVAAAVPTLDGSKVTEPRKRGAERKAAPTGERLHRTQIVNRAFVAFGRSGANKTLRTCCDTGSASQLSSPASSSLVRQLADT